MVSKTINHSECTECGKSLKVHPDSPILSFYKPMISGPTKHQLIGNQCSENCYNDACMRRRQLEAKIIIDNWKNNRKG